MESHPRPPCGADHAALVRECEEVAREARRLLFHTRGRVVRALPRVEAERSRLVEIAERAEALAHKLRRRQPPDPLCRPRALRAPRRPEGGR